MTYKWNYLPISTEQTEASRQLAQDLGCDAADVGVGPGGALEALVVHDDEAAVPAHADVQLRAEVVVGSQAAGPQGVLRDPGVEGVEAPVGIVAVAQLGVEAALGAALGHHAEGVEHRQHQSNQIDDQDDL